MYKPIKDYAIIGNLRSAILISKDGSIDWAPAPFIDSPSVFGALLDDEKGGFWSVQPEGEFTVEQNYIDETNILVTTFTTSEGMLEVTDFIPIEEEKTFVPAEEDTTFKIKRRVMCTKGKCGVRVVFNPKFNYARGETEMKKIDRGIFIQNGRRRGVLVSHKEHIIKEGVATATFVLEEEEADFLVFRYNTGKIALEKDDERHHNYELQENIKLWREWARRCDVNTCPVEGPWFDDIIRSSLVLKILTFEPIGTVAAAPTTSLPEEVGGVRNWDYRFTWLRDSAFIFKALFQLGHSVEAENYISWLVELCSSALSSKKPSNIQIMYGLRGEEVLQEYKLDHLKGYKGSQPVRVGNNAYLQKQWDVYGSIIDMVWNLHVLKGGGAISKHTWTWNLLRTLADYVVTVWREPDEGLWEVRRGKDHFVYSKVLCWTALDRACKLAEAYGFRGDTETWESEKDVIKEEIMKRGWNEKVGAFTQSFDSEHLDASILHLPAVGFIDGKDPKMVSTIRVIQKKLGCDDGLLLRYTKEDGLPGHEGAFLLASFWLVDALVYAGEVDEAKEVFEEVLSKKNHVGLFSEEIDPKTGEYLGNFPQAYTHIGLINSAFLLAQNGVDIEKV